MTDSELNLLKSKIKKAEILQESIDTIDNALVTLNIGRISSFKIQYPGKSNGGFGSEPGDDVTKSMELNNKCLNILESEFSNVFKNCIIESLDTLRLRLKMQYNEL